MAETMEKEVVIAIPKIQTPTSYNDLRPISMSSLWSKILESVVAELTLQETKKNWKENQHGGMKGSLTEHVLIEAWDEILSGLDGGNDNAAVVFTAIDFSKSFSRCGHQEILEAYKRVGASNWLLRMHAAFLMDRTMAVKLGITLSTPRRVTGGAVQGSVLGVMDHNVVLNDIDEGISEECYVAKYIDDLTVIEKVKKEVRTRIDTTANRPLHTIHPEKTQEAFNNLKKNADKKGLKINESKTQLLSVSSAKYDTLAEINTSATSLTTSNNNLKMLGFNFSNKPNVEAQVESLIKKANKRYFVILRHKKAGIPTNKLTEIYCSTLRSVLELSLIHI